MKTRVGADYSLEIKGEGKTSCEMKESENVDSRTSDDSLQEKNDDRVCETGSDCENENWRQAAHNRERGRPG